MFVQNLMEILVEWLWLLLAHIRRCHTCMFVNVVSKWAYSKVSVAEVYMPDCILHSIWHMNGDSHCCNWHLSIVDSCFQLKGAIET